MSCNFALSLLVVTILALIFQAILRCKRKSNKAAKWRTKKRITDHGLTFFIQSLESFRPLMFVTVTREMKKYSITVTSEGHILSHTTMNFEKFYEIYSLGRDAGEYTDKR
jgi:hypothetical protein